MAADIVNDNTSGKMELDVVGQTNGDMEEASTSAFKPKICDVEATAFNNNNNNKTSSTHNVDNANAKDENISVRDNYIPMLKSDPQSIIRKTTVLFKPYLDEPHDSASKADGMSTVVGDFSSLNSHDQSSASMVSFLLICQGGLGKAICVRFFFSPGRQSTRGLPTFSLYVY